MLIDPDVFVLTIDGPVGSGKGTIGQRIAAHFDFNYLDSGALYRVFAYAANQRNINPSQTDALVNLLEQLNIQFVASVDGGVGVMLNGKDITDKIRDEKAGKLASDFACVKSVRASLLEFQRSCAIKPGLVADGRDMGSIVFPHAQLKIFLTASVQKRAERRHKQLNEKGFNVNLARLIEVIQARDWQDESRENSPLKSQVDSVVIDTSNLSIDEVVTRIIGMVEKKLALSSQ